jgi:hypothetical protein
VPWEQGLGMRLRPPPAKRAKRAKRAQKEGPKTPPKQPNRLLTGKNTTFPDIDHDLLAVQASKWGQKASIWPKRAK